MIKKVLIPFFIVLYFQGVEAQNLLQSKPLDYNAGFAGSKTYDRISFHFNEIGENSRDAYFSYDRLVKPLKGGLGLYGNRKQKTEIFENININNELIKVGVAYSPKFTVKNKYQISPSLLIDYNNYNYQRISTLDETNSLLIKENSFGFIGSNIGVLANSKDGYLGYSIKNQFGDASSTLHSLQAGYIQNVCKARRRRNGSQSR